MPGSVAVALDAFVAGVLDASAGQCGGLPTQAYDPDWPSPCLVGDPLEAGVPVTWRPTRRDAVSDFSGLAAALELQPHPDWVTFFGRYWSDHLPAGGLHGRLSLLQLWNAADEERLVANQIGHVLQRRRLRRPVTLFFACGEDPDLLYTMDNATGKVLRENLAGQKDRVLTDDLPGFITSLQPRSLD